MSRLENKECAAISPADPEFFRPFLSGFMTQHPHKPTPPPSITSTPHPSIRSTPPTSPENSPLSFKSAPPRSLKPPLSSSIKSTPAKSSTLALTTTTKSAPLEDIPTIQSQSEPATDDDEYRVNSIDTESTSTFGNILDTVQVFCKHGILAPRKQSRDSKVRVTSAFKLIQSVYKGDAKNDKQIVQRKVTSSDYEHLLLRLSKNKLLQEYFNKKLRFDYSHDKSEFIIRMTSKLHDHVAIKIHDLITEQQKAFQRQVGTRTAELASKIYPLASAKEKFTARSSGKKNGKCPDQSYGHMPCKGYPALVIEVAWSEKPLNLYESAKQYFQGSKGRIRTMVGIDLQYRRITPTDPATPATFLIWRAGELNKRGVPSISEPEKMQFRDRNGQAVPLADLRLPVTDFFCRPCADSFADVTDEIVISSTELCEIVAFGEELELDDMENSQPAPAATSRITTVRKSINNAASRLKQRKAGSRRSARLIGRTED